MEKGDDMGSIRLTRSIAVLTAAAVLAVAAAVAAAGCGSGGSGGGDGQTGSAAGVEIVAPADFSVTDYAGKPLVLNFFGSWCGPCNSEAPDLSAFAKDHPEVGFVGIALNDSEADATGFMAKYGLTYPLVVDDNSLAAKYAVSAVPTTIFFDAQGAEKDRIVGAASGDEFSASLAKAQ